MHWKTIEKRKIGFTGTRWGMTRAQLTMFVHMLPPPSEFHHGGCKGADVEAATIVAALVGYNTLVICHPGIALDGSNEWQAVCKFNDRVLIQKTHFARNRDIVDETDELIAAPFDSEKRTGGTWYTINYARKKGKKVTIIDPSGQIINPEAA